VVQKSEPSQGGKAVTPKNTEMKKLLIKLAEGICLLIFVCSCSPKTLSKSDVEAFQDNTISDDMAFYYKGSKDKYDYFKAQWTETFKAGDFSFRVRHGELSVGEQIEYTDNRESWRKLNGSMYDDPSIVKHPDPSIVDGRTIEISPLNGFYRYFTESRRDSVQSYFTCKVRVKNKSQFNIREITLCDIWKRGITLCDRWERGGGVITTFAETRFTPPLKPDESRDILYEMTFSLNGEPSYEGPWWDSFVNDNGHTFHHE
jgi:hypothetical protein